MAATVEFWFEFASTYSYLAAVRIEQVAAAAGVTVRWKPFLLGPIFKAQGWNDSPFNLYPVKGRYMWRDLERTTAREGVPFRKPSVFPRNGLLAARIACLGAEAAWGPEFVRRVFTANFAEDRDIAAPEILTSILDCLGLDGAVLIGRAVSPEAKEALRNQTDRAMEIGIFGAPTFVVRGELYWGNDRLESALGHARAD
jgi:2-hydroxychromene-2-carboxylate isomerase